ncbi:MAG: DUF4215 domain-containing protein [Deltaproteobacteria bacterium]|nr:DUF4215 domain-containing protein [Deltaproteobacteria bacterium]
MKKKLKKMSLMTFLISNSVVFFGAGCILDNPAYDEPGAFVCGDNKVDSETEECDDGNKIDGDGCSADCKFEIDLNCGDGKQDLGEQCDDGNLEDGDGCSSQCQNEDGTVCGDGNITGNEQCDDGNIENGDGCNQFCEMETSASCGDGNLDAGEQCDDGNLSDGDGCDSQCQAEAEVICGDGSVDGDEQCDDGNTNNGDGCDENCQSEAGIMCGNGILEAGEECDDNNMSDGDGCNAACQYEECGFGDMRQCGDGIWSFHIGHAGTDRIQSIATDSQGNTYAAGNFSSTVVDFNPLGQAQMPSKNGGIFLAKYNANGQIIWLRDFYTATDAARVSKIEVDSADNVYVYGDFISSIDFIQAKITSKGQRDIFMVKFDSNGSLIWATSFGGEKNEFAKDLSLNSQGDSALACSFDSASVNFGQINMSNDYDQVTADACIVKLNVDGAVQWVKSIPDGGANAQTFPHLATNELGQVYWGGDPSPNVNLLNLGNNVTIGDGSLWLIKFDTNGTALWAKSYGVSDGKIGRILSMALDPQGQIWISGRGLGIDLGGGPINNAIYFAGFDSSNGSYLTSKNFTSNETLWHSLSFDYQGNMVFSGHFYGGAVDFGLGQLSGGNVDLFLVKFNSEKEPLWNKAFSYTGSQSYLFAQNRVDPQGYVILGGNFEKTLEIDGNVLDGDTHFIEGFLAKFYP